VRSLLIVLVTFSLLCGCSAGIGVVTPDDKVPQENSRDPQFVPAERVFPNFELKMGIDARDVQWKPSPRPALPSPLELERLHPVVWSNPDPMFPQTSYAFTKANSATTAIGKIYYSSGDELPYLIWDNGHSPTPSGDWVFFIQPPGANPPGPARWNSITNEVEYLDTTMVDPPCNALVPADNGNMYIYTAINVSPPDTLQGWIHIVQDGTKVWSSYGSYLFPTLSSDGSTAAWCMDLTPNTFGDRDPYVFNIQTAMSTKIFNCGSSEEAQYTALGRNGQIAGFTVAIYGPDGLHDQDVYRWQEGTSFQIDTGEYRWCERVAIADLGKYQTFCANKDPYVYAGYAVHCVRQGIWSSYEVTGWNQSIQDVWPDVSDDGYIIYGNGIGYWSHYIPSLAHADSGYLGAIIDPGGVCRDYSFKN
jgi:hypothetical protein